MVSRRLSTPVLAAILASAAAGVAAERPLTAAAFEARVEGRTLTYAIDGTPYGIERYMTDRRVLWSFLDGQCAIGEWYAEGEAICFVYDTAPDDPQCWLIYDAPDGLRAVLADDPEGAALYEAAEGDEELICENFGT